MSARDVSSRAVPTSCSPAAPSSVTALLDSSTAMRRSWIDSLIFSECEYTELIDWVSRCTSATWASVSDRTDSRAASSSPIPAPSPAVAPANASSAPWIARETPASASKTSENSPDAAIPSRPPFAARRAASRSEAAELRTCALTSSASARPSASTISETASGESEQRVQRGRAARARAEPTSAFRITGASTSDATSRRSVHASGSGRATWRASRAERARRAPRHGRHHARGEQRIRGGREQAERGEREQAIGDRCGLPGDRRLDGDADRCAHHPDRERARREAPARCDARRRGRRVASRSAAPRSASARLAHAHAIAVPAPKQTSPWTASRSSEKAVESPAGSSARNTAPNATSIPERGERAHRAQPGPDLFRSRRSQVAPRNPLPSSSSIGARADSLENGRSGGSRVRGIGAVRSGRCGDPPRAQSGATAASASCIAAGMSPSTRICWFMNADCGSSAPLRRSR